MSKGILILPRFLKEAERLDKSAKAKLMKALRLLEQDHTHPGLQSKRLRSNREFFECRVDQSIRLIYDAPETGVRCWFVGQHDDALAFAERYNSSLATVVDDIEVVELEEDEGKDVDLLSKDFTLLSMEEIELQFLG